MNATFYPSLSFRDADAAIEWLGDAFGFEPGNIHRENGRVRHAELWFGGAAIMLGEGEPREDPAGIYAAVDDLDALYARAGAARVELVRELHDTPYGSREFAARDLDGHIWYFGTYRPER